MDKNILYPIGFFCLFLGVACRITSFFLAKINERRIKCLKKENYIIILDSVLKNINLNSTDKLVLGIIYSLSIKDNICFAKNEYFANQLNISTRTISSTLSKLKKLNLIKIETKNHLRNIYINEKLKQNISMHIEEFF